MVYASSVDGDEQKRDQGIADAVAALASTARDVEGERILAKLRRDLASVETAPPRIGRFEVLGKLGAGAMGIVYRVRDPDLERELAVKVLRDTSLDHHLPLQEARALARLSHPNAVTIYEVGEDRGAIFVAMELVRGKNLRQWLMEPRSRREIVGVMLAAGRGLAAAHQSDLIHGDLKPDNILVGDDRVRVADFGLARLGGEDPPGTGGREVEGKPAPLAGTPAYMAPEQLDGEAASMASDQFAFATTLFEALTGTRPYAGGSVQELRASIDSQHIAPEEIEGLPRWLQRILRRGLDPAPEKRYSDLSSMLAELDRRHTTRRLRVVFGLSLLAMVLVGALSYRQGREHDVCGGGAAHAIRIWNRARAARVRAAFTGTGVARAGRTFEETAGAVRRYLTQWRGAHRKTCEATHLRGEQSATLLDARMRCLMRRLERLGALTRLMEQVRSGPELIAARGAIDDGAALRACVEANAVRAEEALPDDPTQRKRVATLSARLHRGWGLYALGRYRDAARLAATMEPELATITWPLARAEALLFLGAVHGRVGDPGQAAPRLRSALEAAATAGADGLAQQIWRRLLKDALFAGEHQRVLEWAGFAKAAATRVGASSAEIDAIVGEAQLLAGRAEIARRQLEKAVAALTSAKAPGRKLAIALSNLGNAQLQLGDLGAAEASYERALTRVRDDLGGDHPTLARFIDKLGRVAREKGDSKRAIAYHRRALAMREGAFGKDDRSVASSLLELGRASIAAHQLTQAEQHLARALAIRQRAYGEQHLRLANVLEAMGEAAFLTGRPLRAHAHWQRALTIRQQKSPEHRAIKRLTCLLALTPAKGTDLAAVLAACDA